MQCHAFVLTPEERDVLCQRLAEMFPTAAFDIRLLHEDGGAISDPPQIDMAPIGDAFACVAARLRRRNSDDA